MVERSPLGSVRENSAALELDRDHPKPGNSREVGLVARDDSQTVRAGSRSDPKVVLAADLTQTRQHGRLVVCALNKLDTVGI